MQLTYEELARTLHLTSFAIGREATRYYLTGLCFEVDDTGLLRCVATDGHRLACYKPAVSEPPAPVMRVQFVDENTPALITSAVKGWFAAVMPNRMQCEEVTL